MLRLGLSPVIHEGARVVDSKLGAYVEIGARSSVVESEMGDYSYLAGDTDVIYSRIGKFCSIASHVRINPGNHPMERTAQSHFTYRASRYFPGAQDEREFFDWRRSHSVIIGHDVWIGHGAVVLPGRHIGDGAVVAAGAIVTKDVAPYMIVAGNPARPIRRRFSEEIGDALHRLAWWDWTHEQLYAALPDFRTLSADGFLEKYG